MKPNPIPPKSPFAKLARRIGFSSAIRYCRHLDIPFEQAHYMALGCYPRRIKLAHPKRRLGDHLE